MIFVPNLFNFAIVSKNDRWGFLLESQKSHNIFIQFQISLAFVNLEISHFSQSLLAWHFSYVWESKGREAWNYICKRRKSNQIVFPFLFLPWGESSDKKLSKNFS